jgi:hypothetical protein
LIFGIVPRWIAIVVLLIVVFFVVTTCVGHGQRGGSKSQPGDFKPSPANPIAKLFYRPTPVKDGDLSGTCLSVPRITVSGSTCFVGVSPSSDQVRELKLRRDAGGTVTLEVSVTGADPSHPDFDATTATASVTVTDKSALVQISCTGPPCNLTIVR